MVDQRINSMVSERDLVRDTKAAAQEDVKEDDKKPQIILTNDES